MKIRLESSFNDKFNKQLSFIARDSPSRAHKFSNDLLSLIKKIPHYPYKHRKSIYFSNKNIRDLIFKGYVTVYEIKENEIIVFGFKKQNLDF